jgi:hypothetical protein
MEPDGGLYDFMRLRRNGDVRLVIFDRCSCVDDLKGSAGAVCLRCLSHASAFARGIKSVLRVGYHPQEICGKVPTNLIKNKDELLSIGFTSPYFVLHELAPAALRVACIQD